jgi:hypothetical protein
MLKGQAGPHRSPTLHRHLQPTRGCTEREAADCWSALLLLPSWVQARRLGPKPIKARPFFIREPAHVRRSRGYPSFTACLLDDMTSQLAARLPPAAGGTLGTRENLLRHPPSWTHTFYPAAAWLLATSSSTAR